MAEIDGKYEGPSVGRAIQRSKYKKAVAEKEGGEPSQLQQGGHEQLASIHPHAQGATKSFHAYQHPDGKVHIHTHDHQSGKHDHREHADIHSASQHMHEHMGGEQNPGMSPEQETQGTGDTGGGMQALGLPGA